MNPCTDSVLSSPSFHPRRSGSSSGRLGGLVYISWPSLFLVSLVLVACPTAVSAAPPRLGIDDLRRRGSSSQSSTGSISMSVWLPILAVTLVFLLVSLCTCVRRCAKNQAVVAAAANRTTASTPGDANTTNTVRPRRRPQRTPSQISTKSLPAYMKEPGDHELVLYRGPEETEDDQAPPLAMPTLAEDDEEHPEMPIGTYDIALDRIESVDTMADASTTNLIRRISATLPRPPELHHATVTRNHRRSGDGHSSDSVGSEAELLGAHQRSISVDNTRDPRGEAPSYTEAVAHSSSNPALPPLSHVADPATGRARPRFSFLTRNPFSSHNDTGTPSPASPPTRADSPASHMRTGSALSRFSSRESHESHHSRTPSRNQHLLRGHAHSNSSLFRAFRSNSPGLQAGSSTISLDNISAPLTHTVTRAEFRAPKGGLLTPEQVKLITSRDALERFGVPYGPDAVAAFSLSREMGPPPEFDSITGAADASTSESGLSEAVVEMSAPTPDITASDSALPRSTSPSSSPQPSLSDRPDGHPGSRTSHVMDDEAQAVQVYWSDDEGEGIRTALPLTPSTARPRRLSGQWR